LKFWAMATGTVGPDSDTRLTGLMCILFFGLGGFGYLGGPLLTRSGRGTVVRERVQTSAGSEAAFVFPTPRRKRLGRHFSRYALTVGADTFAGEAEDVVEAIKRYKRDARARRSIGGEEEHARLLHELGETTTHP
jgi:hypothetical protein